MPLDQRLKILPLALGGGEPGNELQTPIAVVILGGLLSATGLNMLVLPALYALYGRPPVAAMAQSQELSERLGWSPPSSSLVG